MEKIYKALILWKSRPVGEKDPKSNEEFCERYSITLKDLSSLIDRQEYHDDMQTAILNWARSKLPELMHMAYAEAKKTKSLTSIEKFLNMSLELKNSKTVNQQFNFFTNQLTDEQYRKVVARESRLLEAGIEK